MNEYYVIDCVFDNDTPLLKPDGEIDSMAANFLFKYEQVDLPEPVHLTIAPPMPSKIRLVDGMSLYGGCSVFSKKIYDVLSQHNIPGLQLVPAVITDGDVAHNDYRIANVYHKIGVFDEEKSIYGRISKITQQWEDISKIVLDRDKISAIPLDERLVFVSKENCSFMIYHKSIVDIMMSADPQGIIFTPVEEWKNGNEKNDDDDDDDDEIDFSFLE